MLIEKKIGEEFKDDNGGTIRVEEGCYCQDCIYINKGLTYVLPIMKL